MENPKITLFGLLKHQPNLTKLLALLQIKVCNGETQGGVKTDKMSLESVNIGQKSSNVGQFLGGLASI